MSPEKPWVDMHDVPSRHDDLDTAVGPDPAAITRSILQRYPETVVAEALGATFFSLDDRNWPELRDDRDDRRARRGRPVRPGPARRLPTQHRRRARDVRAARRFDGVARLRRLRPDPPPPVYAKQRWISILNPSDATFRDVCLPLIAEAHDRLTAVNARHRTEADAGTG
jgi:hypothetical protein